MPRNMTLFAVFLACSTPAIADDVAKVTHEDAELAEKQIDDARDGSKISPEGVPMSEGDSEPLSTEETKQPDEEQKKLEEMTEAELDEYYAQFIDEDWPVCDPECDKFVAQAVAAGKARVFVGVDPEDRNPIQSLYYFWNSNGCVKEVYFHEWSEPNNWGTLEFTEKTCELYRSEYHYGGQRVGATYVPSLDPNATP